MNPFLLLPAIVVAAAVFGASLWSVTQAMRQEGTLRLAHVAAAAFVIGVMASIDAGWPLLMRAAGAALMLAALVAIFHEQGWTRVLPGVQAAFGAAAAAGLPIGS